MLAGISCTNLLKRYARRFWSSHVASVRARLVHDDPLGLDAVSDMPEVAKLSFDSSEMFSEAPSPTFSLISTEKQKGQLPS